MIDEINDSFSAEETCAMNAKYASYEARGTVAEKKAAVAFGRLLELAETRTSGQIAIVTKFLASSYCSYNRPKFKFDLFDLRSLDVAVSDDMLTCLDCLRWKTNDLHHLVPGGEERVLSVIKMLENRWEHQL